MAVTVIDCAGTSVSGATVTGPGTAVYTNGELIPDLSATATKQDGTAWFLNVPPGAVAVHAYVPGVGTLRGHTVRSFAGALTIAVVEP